MVDKIDYVHGDSGVKPPDGRDFQRDQAADPQEFDWYISTFVNKINEIVSTHITESSGVHGLGSNENVLGESHKQEESVHHSPPTGTQEGVAYKGSTDWELYNGSIGAYEQLNFNVCVPVKKVYPLRDNNSVILYRGDEKIEQFNGPDNTQTYDEPPFCTQIDLYRDADNSSNADLDIAIGKLSPHTHPI